MKNLKINLGIAVMAVIFVFVAVTSVRAATTPPLGMATSYAILASTFTNTVAGTVVNGDIGFTTGPAVVPGGVHTNYGSGAPFATAGTDQNTALGLLNSQPCNFNFGSATDLSLLSQPLVPGVYCVTGAASIGTGGITLNGSGTYIFRISGALTSVANSAVMLSGGASACDVFWTPTAATTLGANSTFVGTNIGPASITMGSSVSWTGRSLAFGGTITSDADTITVPNCSSPVIPAPIVTSTPTTTPVVMAPIVTSTPVVVVPTSTATPVVVSPVVVEAVPTVVAPVPKLPNTGVAPKSNVLLGSFIGLSSLLLLVLLKKRTA